MKVSDIDDFGFVSNFKTSSLWLSMDWGCRRPACVLLAYRSPAQLKIGNGRVAAPGSIFIVDCIHTNVKNGAGEELWNVGDTNLTTGSMTRRIEEMLARYGLRVKDISKRHRVADAAIGAIHGGDTGSIGAQFKKYGCEFIAAPKGKRPPGWTMVKTLMEAAGDSSAPGLYCCSRVRAFWQTLPSLQYDEHNPEDLNSNGCITLPTHYVIWLQASQTRNTAERLDSPTFESGNTLLQQLTRIVVTVSNRNVTDEELQLLLKQHVWRN